MLLARILLKSYIQFAPRKHCKALFSNELLEIRQALSCITFSALFSQPLPSFVVMPSRRLSTVDQVAKPIQRSAKKQRVFCQKKDEKNKPKASIFDTTFWLATRCNGADWHRCIFAFWANAGAFAVLRQTPAHSDQRERMGDAGLFGALRCSKKLKKYA